MLWEFHLSLNGLMLLNRAWRRMVAKGVFFIDEAGGVAKACN